MIKVWDYRTMKLLATIEAANISKWCSANGYLPHHKRGSSWVVIAA